VAEDKQRYWITYLLKDLQVGDNFKPGVLHLTVIPWFVTELAGGQITEIFSEYFKNQPSFKVQVSKITDFKHKRKIPVNLVKPTSELIALHQKALELFEALGARWAVRVAHAGTDYVPHIRRRPGGRIKEGDELKISSIYLIQAARNEDGQRTVATKVEFT
jgi:2'-5' RNA ligase